MSRPLITKFDLNEIDSIDVLYDFITEKVGCEMMEPNWVHTKASEASSMLSVIIFIISTEDKFGIKTTIFWFERLFSIFYF